MEIKEKAIKEIEALKPDELLIVNDLILSLRSKIRAPKSKERLSYVKVKEALRGCKGSLSEDVLSAREERI